MEKTSKQSEISKKNIALSVLFTLAPVIVSLTLMAIKWISQGYVAFPGMKWNDEAAYIKLIQTYSEFLSPKGYWGFNGNHAVIGTGSAWNVAIIAPYAIFGRVFPVGSSFVYFCNMFYITLANFLLLLLTKPSCRAKIRLILAEVTGTVFILYLNTDMSETFRFALAIILVSLLYKVYFDECPKWLKYIVTPVFIVYTIQVYTFFAFCIPIYVFAITKKMKLWKRFLFSFIAMGVIAGGSYFLLHLVSSNYNIAKTEKLLNAIKSGNILGAARSFAGMVKDGLVGIYNLIFTVYSNGIYVFHLMISIILSVTGLIMFFNKKSKEKDKTIGMISAYSICIFFFMYMTLYTIVPDTFMRGTEIAVVFSLMFMMLTEGKWVAGMLIVFNAVGLLFLPLNLKNFQGEERYYTKEEQSDWKELSENFESVLSINEDGDRFDNMIMMYTMEPRAIAAVPAGLGVNFVLSGEYVNSEAGYLLFTKHEERRADWIETDYRAVMGDFEEEITASYDEVYSDGEYVIYKKR